MIKIAIVEDEIEMKERLEGFVSDFLDKESRQYSISSFASAESFSSSSMEFDLIFMDINLPGENGMEATRKIRDKDGEVMIIFVTSLVQFAVKGYEVKAFDYLVKPVNYASFELTMRRALPTLEARNESIVVTDSNRVMHKIYLNDLHYIEVREHVLFFHLSKEVIKVYDQLKKYEEMLGPYSFASCNRSYIVNLKFVVGIDKNDVLVGGDRLPIARPKKTEFIEKLNKYFSSGVIS